MLRWLEGRHVRVSGPRIKRLPARAQGSGCQDLTGRCCKLSAALHSHRREVDPTSCSNNCSSRGTCRQGFCHCQQGWFGHDCSRSNAYHPPLLGADHPVPYGQLRVYIYELPWQKAFNLFPNTRGHYHDQIYVGYQHFHDTLSKDTAIRTEDPWWVPAGSCLLPAACCLLPAACCLLPAACCLLPAACCLLRAAAAVESASKANVTNPVAGRQTCSTCRLSFSQQPATSATPPSRCKRW